MQLKLFRISDSKNPERNFLYSLEKFNGSERSQRIDMKHPHLIFALLLAAAAFADETVRFVPEPYELGEISQGDVRHVKLGGANVSSKTLKIESALCQGTGCSRFQFTRSAEPREPVNVEFDFSTEAMEGLFENVVVLVEPDGTPHPTVFRGVVKAPFLFSEKMFDAGYYQPGEKREWQFYVWAADQKTRPDLELSKECAGEFSMVAKKVGLDVENPASVKEGGKVPGLKITLRVQGLVRGVQSKQKSLSKIVAFKSKTHPKATPEVLVIGYWK